VAGVQRAVQVRHHGLPTGWLAAVGWLLTLPRRRVDRQVRFGPALGRGAYAAFTLYGPVLIGLAVALRTMWVPARISALVVAVGGITAPSHSPKPGLSRGHHHRAAGLGDTVASCCEIDDVRDVK